MTESVAVRRLCLVADIEGYSQNDNRAQEDLQRRLKDVLDRTLKSAEVAPGRTERQDQNGRQLILLPVGVNEAAVVPLLIRGLLDHLSRDRQRSPRGPLRLRASLVQGVVTQARTGYVGRAVVLAARLLDSRAVGEELAAQRVALFALIVPDDLYQDVVAQGYGDLAPGGFRQVRVDLPDKGWHADAWLRAWEPGSLKPLPNRTLKGLRDAVAAGAGALAHTLDDAQSHAETGNESDPTAHDPAAHDTAASHEAELDMLHVAAEEHAYVVEEYPDHTEYVGYDYESSDFSADSHEGSY